MSGPADDGERSTWSLREGDELVPGVLAWGLLGRGRRFELWIGWCRDRLTPVCVKIPRRDAGPGAVDALRREFRAASAMAHPAIPRVFAADLGAPLPYLVNEFIEGRPLSAVLHADGPFDHHDVILLGLQLAAALRHVHGRGFVHHDLKPSNVLLRGDRVVVVDFDLALPVGTQRAGPGPRGTPGYMAPEQLERAAAQPTMDLHALGLVLYEAATGRPLLDPDAVHSELDGPDQLDRDGIPDIGRDIGSTAPSPLGAVLRALLRPRPVDRPPDAAAAVRLLQAALPAGGPGLWPAWVVPAVLGDA